MKKGVLILLGMFMMVSTVEAKNGSELPNRNGFNYSYNNSVNFEERGVEFFIFTNGEFDFNTHYNDTYYDYNGNRIRRENGIRIDRDYRGRIQRIGNSFVNYDNYGNVTRIGNVFMRYYRGKLTDVGNLKIRYDHWGNPKFYGNVKNNYYNYNGVRINLNIGDVFDYNNSYFSHRDFSRNYSRIREDKNYYYYKANANAKIGKRSQILRRRKPATTISNRKPVSTTRGNNITYRRPSTIESNRKVISDKRSNPTTNRRPSALNDKKSESINKRNSTTTSRRPTTVTRGNTTTERSSSTSSNRKPTTVKRDTKEQNTMPKGNSKNRRRS